MYTGLRLGEICGLKREDIDLEEKTITVKRNIVRLRIHEGARKTKTGGCDAQDGTVKKDDPLSGCAA